MREVLLALILSSFFGATSSFALQECMIVCARGDLVWLNFILQHFFVQFSKFVYLFTVATRIKQSPVDILDVTHGLYPALNIVE